MIKHVIKLIWNKKGSNSLMMLEIFLSFIVLFFVMAFVLYNFQIINKPLGFETENKWMISLDKIPQMDSALAVITLQNLRQNLLSEDEIKGVTFTQHMAPFIKNSWCNRSNENGFQMTGCFVFADLDFKDVLEINVKKGRWFNEDDTDAKPHPVLVNQKFIDDHYPNKPMIDSIFLFDDPHKIVGIIEEYKHRSEFEEPQPIIIYLRKFTENRYNVILDMQPGTSASYEEKLANIVSTSTKTDGSVIESLEKKRTEDGRTSWIMIMALLFICGFLCLNVALGLFGVLWHNISKRKSEIGLRQALGANTTEISKQFMLEVLVLTGSALLIGVFFAVQVPLLNVTEFEDGIFYKAIVLACLIILTLVFLCALFPSLQAAKITPANSLHED